MGGKRKIFNDAIDLLEQIEEAAVLAIRYEKISSQGERNDIFQEGGKSRHLCNI